MTLDAGDRTIFAFRRNVVVAASAGTGKTHRLTALYAMLALGLTSMGERDEHTAASALAPERIVATTFSRAAAREIARRAERALVGLAEGSPHPFEAEVAARLAELGGTIAPRDVRTRAKQALAGFGRARIDTLHGVARRIVAKHAFALDEPQGARVLEEDELEALGAAAVDAALSDALAAGGAREAAARGVVSACGGGVLARKKLGILFDRLDEEGILVAELALVDHAAEAKDVAARVARVAKQSATSGCAKSRGAAAAVAASLAKGAVFSDAAFTALLDLLSVRLPREADRSAADRDLDALRGDLHGNTKAQQADELAAWLAAAPTLDVKERAAIAVLADARARFAASKRRAGGLGFGDLLRIARDALRDRPDVAESARGEVGALLVDELQDTSRIQRDIVYLLRERDDSTRAAGEGPSPEHLEGHGLFLVGDRKQSIYGFRGADVAVFARACAELAGEDAERALALPPAKQPRVAIADFVALTTSRRSGGRVLAFVNAFSELDFTGDRAAGVAPRPFEIAYGPGEHLAAVAGREDEGEVVVVRDDLESPEGTDALVARATGVAREAHVAAAAAAIEIAAHARAPRDVAILARRRSTIPLVEIALTRLAVPYVVAGRALYDTSEVRDAAALLRLLLDPRDRLAAATVLRGPMVALSDPSLAALSTRGGGLQVALGRGPRIASRVALPRDERARLDAFAAAFAALRPALLALPPGEALRLAARSFDLERVLAALPRAEARLANLDRLVALARRRGGTLAGFSRWLDQRIDDDADEPEAAVFSAEDDAVRLTTIHASKGLDFPVVVLVDLEAEPGGEPASLGFFHDESSDAASFVMRHHAARPGARRRVASTPIVVVSRALEVAQAEARAREAAERRRLTYVAITRARSKLVLVGAASQAKPRAGSAWRALASALDQGALEGLATTARARDLLAAAASVPPRPADVASERPKAPRLPTVAPARTVSIATTPLAVFGGCARRFRLRYLLGLEEPVEAGEIEVADDGAIEIDVTPDQSDGDPRALGRAAHRVLERWPLHAFGDAVDPREVERRLARTCLAAAPGDLARTALAIARFVSGDFARSIRAGGASIAREVPFALALPAPSTGDGPARELVVRGAIDLVIRWPDGRVDVVDYKLAAPSATLERHAFQLRTYALAAARGDVDVAAAAVHLFGDGRPAWLAEGDAVSPTRVRLEHADAFARDLASLAHRFATARHARAFDPVQRPTCERLGCGFVTACHGAGPSADAPAPQLDLFPG